jgi:AcrR family transcriptional regulator
MAGRTFQVGRRERRPLDLDEVDSITGSFADPTYDKIIDGIYKAFEELGRDKATMLDIARISGVSRATLYKYFSSKNDVISRVALIETAKMTAAIRQIIKKGRGLADTLVDCIATCTKLAWGNPHLRMLTATPEVAARTANPQTRAHLIFRRQWGSLFETAMARGELHPNLSLDDVTSWLVLGQDLLLIKTYDERINDDELRKFIRHFIVQPVLNPAIYKSDGS